MRHWLRRLTSQASQLQIDASIGIAFTGRGSDTPEELIHDADLAMYRTKRHRVHGHKVLDLRELHLAEHHASLARGLPGAAERDELHVEYQPIVTTRRRAADRNGGAAALDAPQPRSGTTNGVHPVRRAIRPDH